MRVFRVFLGFFAEKCAKSRDALSRLTPLKNHEIWPKYVGFRQTGQGIDPVRGPLDIRIPCRQRGAETLLERIAASPPGRAPGPSLKRANPAAGPPLGPIQESREGTPPGAGRGQIGPGATGDFPHLYPHFNDIGPSRRGGPSPAGFQQRFPGANSANYCSKNIS